MTSKQVDTGLEPIYIRSTLETVEQCDEWSSSPDP
jgi:hypothetical protein